MTLDDTSSQTDNPYAADEGRPSHVPGHIPLRKHPNLVIKTELLARPDPFTLYFGFFGDRAWQQKAARNLNDRVANAEFLLNRAPTQDELDAFTVFSSRYVYHQRMGAPIASSVFFARAYMQVRASEPVRLFTPGLAEGAKPTAKQVVDAVRAYARVDNAGFRQALVAGSLRWFFWTMAGSAASSLWAVYHDTIGSLGDPRLRQFLEEIRQQNPETVRQRKLDAMRERQKQHSGQRQQREPAGADADDASPAASESAEMETGYGYGEGYGARTSGNASVGVGPGVGASGGSGYGAGYGYGYSGQDASSSTKPAAPASSSSTPRPYGDSNTATHDQNQGSSSDFFDSDDMSPVAADYRSEGLTGSLQGSAWDRIRQQSGSASPGRSSPLPGLSSQPSPPSQSSSTQWDSWKNPNQASGVAEIEQRQREQAQAEFDRLLEAERNLGNEASDGSGRKSGWGRWN